MKHAYARVSARKQSRNGRSPIDLKKKLVAAELIVHQHRSYKEVSELTFYSHSFRRALKLELLEKETS